MISKVLVAVLLCAAAVALAVDAHEMTTAHEGDVFLDQGMMSDDHAGVLAKHNELRQAAGLAPLQWSDSIATFSQSWAAELAKNNCEMKHSTNKQRSGVVYPGGQGVGENLAWASGYHRTYEQSTQAWYDEISVYNFGTTNSDCTKKNPNEAVGHFTQVMWSDTAYLGCGRAICSNSEVTVCNYGPPGNYIGRTPFSIETARKLNINAQACGYEENAPAEAPPAAIPTPAPVSGGWATGLTAESLASLSYFCYQYYYAYRDGKYYRYDADAKRITGEYQLGEKTPFGNIDAAIEIRPDASSNADKKLILVKDNQYVEKSPYCSSCKASTAPAPLSNIFPGMSFEMIDDAAIKKGTDMLYVFKGDEMLIYDNGAKKQVPGYPQKIVEVFPGLDFASVDAVTRPRYHWCSGDFIFTKGADYKCYNVKTRSVTKAGKWADLLPGVAPNTTPAPPAATPAPSTRVTPRATPSPTPAATQSATPAPVAATPSPPTSGGPPDGLVKAVALAKQTYKEAKKAAKAAKKVYRDQKNSQNKKAYKAAKAAKKAAKQRYKNLKSELANYNVGDKEDEDDDDEEDDAPPKPVNLLAARSAAPPLPSHPPFLNDLAVPTGIVEDISVPPLPDHSRMPPMEEVTAQAHAKRLFADIDVSFEPNF